MINKVQNSFSIQDLEILSGIKAHTIRIWEKRYDLLHPTRLNRNIRVYDLIDLQKLLNVSLILNFNYKISEVSRLTDDELKKLAKSISLDPINSNYHINSLIVSMFSFDEALFEETYQIQIKTKSFSEICIETYLPLLTYMGILWQTNGIKPSNERFISNLIYQKIVLNIASIEEVKTKSKEVNILFLPEGELHELGLLFHTYQLKLSGKRTIYLGKDIPTEDLFSINSQFEDINWICSFTISRTDEEKDAFIADLIKLMDQNKNTCSVIGKTWSGHSILEYEDRITFYEGFDTYVMK